MHSKTLKGQQGQNLAESFLSKKQNLKIIERNWRCFLGEIDLVARDNEELVFIEVKSRYGDTESGWEALHRDKQEKLRRLAHAYLKAKKLPLETELRFDAVIVDLAGEKIEHEPSAFLPEKEI